MNRHIVFIVGCLLMHNIAFAQTPANDPHWQLKWSDDFNSLNTSIWNVFDNFDHHGKESVSLSSNVYINNNTLILRAKKEYYCCPTTPVNYVNEWRCKREWATGNCYQYTGSWVETKPEYSTKFGYIEARIKMTFRKGVGFAFWTLKEAGGSNAAEIDIFETLVPNLQQAPDAISTCVWTCYPNEDTVKVYGFDPKCIRPKLAQHHYLPNFNYTNWHTYSIEWDADRITWYVDNKAIRTAANRNWDNYGHSVIDPVKLILGGSVFPEYLQPPYSMAIFEEYMYVDYVKVYQLKCDTNTVVTMIRDFSPRCYNYAVKKSITLDSSTTIPAGSNICLRAKDFIELKNGFEVPLGAELYLGVSPCHGVQAGTLLPCPESKE